VYAFVASKVVSIRNLSFAAVVVVAASSSSLIFTCFVMCVFISRAFLCTARKEWRDRRQKETDLFTQKCTIFSSLF
jgi:hypothetical protein